MLLSIAEYGICNKKSQIPVVLTMSSPGRLGTTKGSIHVIALVRWYLAVS
jgi:hypothetical protein